MFFAEWKKDFHWDLNSWQSPMFNHWRRQHSTIVIEWCCWANYKWRVGRKGDGETSKSLLGFKWQDKTDMQHVQCTYFIQAQSMVGRSTWLIPFLALPCNKSCIQRTGRNQTRHWPTNLNQPTWKASDSMTSYWLLDDSYVIIWLDYFRAD